MKPNRIHLFIAISSVALLIVLVIQVNWLFQTARIKEELFNEKANMVLSRTAEAISSDTASLIHHGIYVNDTERRKIDSLLNHYMQLYNIHIDYSFEVMPAPIATEYPGEFIQKTSLKPSGVYQTCIQDVPEGKEGLELKLVFPKKKQYLVAEMGMPFISSVILILIVLVMSWRTILSLMKEKKISEHTTEFLNNMTHEFKTPLTNIALAGRMMIKDSTIRQEEKIMHYSGIILEENEKLRLQVEQVLSMTALERGEIPFRKTEQDVHQLIRDALKCMSMQLESAGGHVQLHLDAEKHWIQADRTHLINALCNLVDNTIKYAAGNPELSIYTSDRGTDLVIVVSDKGTGIDKEYQKKVFDKYFRVPTGDVHDVKGFGLGLAYVKKIVELHEGTIELHSEKASLPDRQGKGTTFTITLPHA